MDAQLASLERMLKASGQQFKVLDERSINLLTEYFKVELLQAQKKHTRAPGLTGKAIAFERMNNIASLMELILP